MASLKKTEPGYLIRHRVSQRLHRKPVMSDRPQGYNPQIILSNNGKDKYICGSCHQILKQPLQSFCGHRFCTECFSYILSSAGDEPVQCQLCIQEDTVTDFSILKREQTFPDNGVRRELEVLKAVCINPGCDWKGSFKDYLSHEATCAHKQVQCHQCGGFFTSDKLADHQASSCPMVPDQCPHCNTAMLKGELMLHYCADLPVQCSGCERKLLKKELLEHSDPDNNLCSSPSVPCLFGCNEVVPVAQLKTHLKNNLDGHISELDRRINELELQLKVNLAPSAQAPAPADTSASAATPTSLQLKIDHLEKRLSTSEAKITEVVNELLNSGRHQAQATADINDDSKHQVEILDRKILIFEKVSAVFKREIEKCGKQVDSLLRDNQTNKDRLEHLTRDINATQQQCNTQKSQIENLTKTIQTVETASYDGVLLWKITDFFQRRQKAVHGQVTSFYSPPFYTSRTGYKACARIYLNGDGMGKDTHVSLFFVLMRGEYDAVLQWPFQQKVTMTWIDQNLTKPVIDTFRPDPTSSSFKRPTSDMNIASGCPLFMKLSELDNEKYAYVKDNTAFIKIAIDTSNIRTL